MPNGFDGLDIIDSSNNVIGGVSAQERNVFSGNTEMGVAILNVGSFGNELIGNYIGTDVNGLNAIANGYDGVLVSALSGEPASASDNIIGGTNQGEGNTISGNGRMGVHLFHSSGNKVLRNFIGVDKVGANRVANGGDGVHVDEGAENQIGSLSNSNVISGNRREGIAIFGVAATGNVISSNLIGIDATGVTPIPNDRIGILLSSLDAGGPSSGTTVGGIEAGTGNVISGNGSDGIQIAFGSSGNFVLGNRVGTDDSGDLPVPNVGHGVSIYDSTSNTIGGVEESADNLISGNKKNGILIAKGVLGNQSTGNSVMGNRVGVNFFGDLALPNQGHGIHMRDSGDNVIGGIDDDAKNTISGNAGSGIFISASTRPATSSLVMRSESVISLPTSEPWPTNVMGLK